MWLLPWFGKLNTRISGCFPASTFPCLLQVQKLTAYLTLPPIQAYINYCGGRASIAATGCLIWSCGCRGLALVTPVLKELLLWLIRCGCGWWID